MTTEYKLPEPSYEHWGRGIDPVYGYSANQMHQAYQAGLDAANKGSSWATGFQQGHEKGIQAGRGAMREEAIRVCVDIANAPSNCVLGVALNCADKIRELK